MTDAPDWSLLITELLSLLAPVLRFLLQVLMMVTGVSDAVTNIFTHCNSRHYITRISPLSMENGGVTFS